MQLHKTDRGRAELRPGVRTLGQRERSLLLLADGSKSLQDLQPMFNGSGADIALWLMREGFLQLQAGAAPEPARQAPRAAAASAPSLLDVSGPASLGGSTDQFDGKRSLATTRMFLFDICERMFSQRHPDLADHFREALRQARDRQTMLLAARGMLAEIEKVAGHERADAISERIAMLLPSEPPA